MKMYTWIMAVVSCLTLVCVVLCSQPAMALASSFSDRTVEIENAQGERWEFKVQFGDGRDSIFYTYSTSDGKSLESTVETQLYSDTAPTAVLLGDIPILAWSSLAVAQGDSDIYFATWTGNGWSEPRMVHADNALADMSPELTWNDAGQLVLSWWRNTGSDIVQIWAVYNEGRFAVENDVVAAAGKATTKASSYYSSISGRGIADPFKCIAIGDSITAGCKRDAAHNVNYWCGHDRTGETEGGYVDTLQELLQDINSNSRVYNYGHPGERSYEGASRINTVMSAHSDANCILIMFGANDRYEELHPTSTRANIKLMADRAIARGIAPVITTITPNTAVWDIDQYNYQIKDLARDYGIIMADQYGALWYGDDPEYQWESKYSSGDNLHVSDAGDVLVGNEWFETMQTSKLFFPDFSLPGINLLLLKND